MTDKEAEACSSCRENCPFIPYEPKRNYNFQPAKGCRQQFLHAQRAEAWPSCCHVVGSLVIEAKALDQLHMYYKGNMLSSMLAFTYIPSDL